MDVSIFVLYGNEKNNRVEKGKRSKLYECKTKEKELVRFLPHVQSRADDMKDRFTYLWSI